MGFYINGTDIRLWSMFISVFIWFSCINFNGI